MRRTQTRRRRGDGGGEDTSWFLTLSCVFELKVKRCVCEGALIVDTFLLDGPLLTRTFGGGPFNPSFRIDTWEFAERQECHSDRFRREVDVSLCFWPYSLPNISHTTFTWWIAVTLAT